VNYYLVGGLEHFYFAIQLGTSLSQLTFTPSFFRGLGRKTTNQYFPVIIHILMVFSTRNHPYHPFIDGGRSTTNQPINSTKFPKPSPYNKIPEAENILVSSHEGLQKTHLGSRRFFAAQIV
jgi:hypothetical protein